MKIAIPVNEDKTSVCMSFGRTLFFMMYDTETKEETFLDNSAAASQGGAGIKAAQSIVDKGAKILLTPRCGENAANVLNAANIKIYRTVGDSVKENIQAFMEDKLAILENIHPGFHHSGGH